MSELGNGRSSIDSESRPSCVLISTSNYCEESRWIPDGLSFAHPPHVTHQTHHWSRKVFIYLFFLLPCENMTLSESEKPPGNRAQPELITVSPFSRWSGCQGRTWTAPVREAVWCLTAVWGQQVRLHLHLPEATENVCVKFGEGTQICACSTHQQTFGCNGTVFSFFSPPPPSMLNVNLFPK